MTTIEGLKALYKPSEALRRLSNTLWEPTIPVEATGRAGNEP